MSTFLKRGATHLIAGLCLFPLTSFGHHSVFGRFDQDASMEIEGRVTEVLWRNPHVYVIVEVRDQNDERVVWELETNTASRLLRSGIQSDAIKVGDQVKAAGWPPTTAAREIFATNLLLPSGEELILTSRAEPIWKDEVTGDRSFQFQTEGDASSPELGIFRAWSHTSVIPMLFPAAFETEFDVYTYPMTDVARAALAAYDPATDNPTINCLPKGMPTIMEQPYPMEFVRQDENIALHIEEYDLIRTIHMGANSSSEAQPLSPLGYSVGRWDGDTLVVTTTRLDWPFFDQTGIPQSENSELVERFNPTEDGSRLDYEIIVTDPVTFTEPVTSEKYWLYLPDAEIQPYNCSVRG